MVNYEDIEYYTIVAKDDGSNFTLYGTDYTVPVVTVTEIKDDHTFVYYATNESGTRSYGEATYSEVYIV